jgi:signal transduction histidine kinase
LRAQAKPVIEHWLYTKDYVIPGLKSSASPESLQLGKIATPLARDLTSRNTAALILDKTEKVLAVGKHLPEEPIPPPPNPAYTRLALAGQNEINYKMTWNGDPTLVVLIPLRSSPGSKTILGVAQLSTSLAPINRILLWNGLMLLGVMLLTLLIGGGIGLWVTSSNLRGLREVAQTCKQIASGDFTRRVTLPDSRDEVHTLAQAFNLMVERIEAIFESQRRFVANTAHELRTPLTALRGSLEVLLRGAQDDPSAVARLSRGMVQEVDRLIHLCEQLLGLTKLESTQHVQKKPLNLSDFFEDFLPQARILAQNRSLSLQSGPFVSVKVDEDMLKQILLNLLQNAIQHTKEGGTILLGWHLIPDFVEIWVQDDGEGIPPQELPYIFEPFFQGKSPVSRRKQGAGLGLPLVKAMVEAHGGQIWVESQSGQGSRFAFHLPL